MTTETKAAQTEVWLAVPKASLDAILNLLGELPFKMVAPVAPVLLNLQVKEVTLVTPPKEAAKE